MRTLFAAAVKMACVTALLSQPPGPADAAEPPVVPTLRPADLAGLPPKDLAAWRTILVFAEQGEWDRALAVTGQADNAELGAVLKWLALRDSGVPTDFETASMFLDAHPDWPGLRPIRARAETLMPEDLPAARKIDYFERHRPLSNDAILAHLHALKSAGRDDALAARVREVWSTIEFSKDAQRDFLKAFGSHLTEQDHVDRLDGMLWRGREGAARHMLDLVPSGWVKLADARLRLRYGKAGVDAAISAVPKSLVEHPGLIYERARWRRNKGLESAARDLLLGAPGDPDFQKRLWNERNLQIRNAIEDRNYTDAYLLAAGHNQLDGIGFATAEWLAGWVALRYLDRPEDAFRHFTVMHGNVGTPISLSRGAYWAGRAAEAMKDKAALTEWYRKAAEHGTTFYGQLAAARLGMEEPPLDLDGWPTKEQVVAFQNKGPIRAATELLRIGHRDLAERFLFAVYGDMSDGTDAILLADMALKSGLPKVAVFTARRAGRLGASLVERGYPVIDLDPKIGPELALVHAIIRQESSFDREAISRVGARGLMQLMPATAKATSASIDLPYRLGGLLADGDYNIALGRAYLRQMLDRFDGSLVMAIASYNAGPHRVDQWIIRNGDPRDPNVNIVDWIEQIPFSETRNYVQRVLEALQVYRSRLSSGARVIEAAQSGAGKARDVWCVFKCGVLLDGGTKPATIVVENKAQPGG